MRTRAQWLPVLIELSRAEVLLLSKRIEHRPEVAGPAVLVNAAGKRGRAWLEGLELVHSHFLLFSILKDMNFKWLPAQFK